VRQDCKKKKLIRLKLLRLFPEETAETGRAVARVPLEFAIVQATKENRSDVVARKNALQDNCMYVNDGVISLRLLRKRERRRTREEERKGSECARE